MDTRFKEIIRPLSRWMGIGLLVLSVCIFVIAPTRTFHHFIPNLAQSIQTYQLFVVFVLILGGAVLYGISRILSDTHPTTSIPIAPKSIVRPSYFSFVLWILTSVILLRLISQINDPLHWEDHRHFCNTILYPLKNLNAAVNTEHHASASMAALGSVKLFGMSKLSAKIPAVLFACGFLTLLILMVRRYLGSFAAFLVLAHFASNKTALWYMQSLRGYVAAMFFSLASLFIILEATQRIPKRKNLRIILFVLLGYLCAFTHLFAILFHCLLFLTLVIWMNMNRIEITRAQLEYCTSLILAFGFLVAPLFVVFLIHQAVWLHGLGDFLSDGETPMVSIAIQRLFGLSYDWQFKLLLIFIFILAVMTWVKSKRNWDYVSVFLLTSITFFFSVGTILHIRIFEARYILPFLAPAVFWLGDATTRFQKKTVRMGTMAFGGLLLVLSPLVSTAAIYDYLTLNIRDFDLFIEEVRVRTHPIQDNCYTYEGEPNLILFSQTLYLGPFQGVPKTQCRSRYHIYFESPNNLPPIDTRETKYHTYEEIFRKGDKMVLYKRVN